jgi:heme oxygenase (biliverdin-IX-beta and delta-forming)
MAVFVVNDSTSLHEAALAPAASSLILSRLRIETRGEHEAVEQVLDLMSASLTHDGYRQRLEQFYGFYAPLEKALKDSIAHQHHTSGEPNILRGTRSALSFRLNKTALLQHDLHHLGVVTQNIPLCRELPPLEAQAEVLGCIYVMEGATLGGQMITRHVLATLGITPETGGRFFHGYGDDTGKMWQGMRQLLVSGASDTRTENIIVATAITSFACLRRWCQSSQ